MKKKKKEQQKYLTIAIPTNDNGASYSYRISYNSFN